MKDIFIDNSVAKVFANPMDPEYKKLIVWLIAFHPQDAENNAHLVVSNKLLVEYSRTAGYARSATSIVAVVDTLTKHGRLVKITNSQIKEFKRQYFKKRVRRMLTCNTEDRDHIPVVLLSHRRYALSLDWSFITDLRNFPGFVVVAERRPQDLPYDE